MSNYGRLWQEVSNIRDALKKLVSHANTNTLADAERTCADAIITFRDAGNHDDAKRIEGYLSVWADLERRMERCND